MTVKLDLEKIKDLLDEEEQELIENKSNSFRNHSKRISIIIGYLLGVKEEYLKLLPSETDEYEQIINHVKGNSDVEAIRALNNLRSNMMLGFKEISRRTKVTANDYAPIDKIEMLADDFKTLSRLNIDISCGKNDINAYIKRINAEVLKRIDKTKVLFPEWVEFKHIKQMFIMPADIETESKRFQNNQSCYPYKRYFYWTNPSDKGNLLLNDEKLLETIYFSNGDYFTDTNRVVDVSDKVKISINDFIEQGNKIQFFIDGENADPYNFAAAIDSLSDSQIEKVDKIVVYYDSKYSVKAWQMLKHFAFGIEVEAIAVNRLLEGKSLVDHKMVAGVSKAVYHDGVDSIVIVSSDSDFWSVIEDVKARYMVMVEEEKVGYQFKEVMRNNHVFYCYFDRFIVSDDNEFFHLVIRNELQRILDDTYGFVHANAYEIVDRAIRESRASVSAKERDNVVERYIKGMVITVSKDGDISFRLPD